MLIFSENSRIIAHRGASALAPENTLAAFKKAHVIGAKWVEFDVMLSACGEAVVIHDETLERTTNGQGRVIDYPYSFLETLDAGSWFNPLFKNEKIPTLAAVLDLLCELGLSANVEIKPMAGLEEKTVKKVVDVIDHHWRPEKTSLFISSFSRIVLEQARRYSKKHHLACLMNEWREDWKKTGDGLNCIAMDVNYTILNAARVDEIKSTDQLILSYTVDDPAIAQQLFDWGVDAVFSNCPLDIHRFL